MKLFWMGYGLAFCTLSALLFFLCDRNWGWYGTTPMLCGYGLTAGVVILLTVAALTHGD